MRADSNSVLSLSSGVPPKKAPFVQAPSKKGEAFSDDFNKAKETLNTSKASTASASTAESSPTSDHVSSVTKVSDKHSVPVNDKQQGEADSSDASDIDENSVALVAASSESSGKTLQDNGEDLPSNTVPVEGSDDGVELPAMGLSAGLVNSDAYPVSADSLERDVNTVLSVPAAEQGEALSTDVLGAEGQVVLGGDASTELNVAPVQSAVATNESKKATVPVVGAGVVGLDAIKRSNSSNLNTTDYSAAPIVLSDSAKDYIESLQAEGNVEMDGELSWVLSQMGGEMKAAPVNSSESVAIESAKTTVAAAGVAGMLSKSSRSDVSPLILSEGAIVNADTEGAAAESADSLLGDDGVLVNEPIELRKKEQEAMLGRMSAQVDSAAADDVATGGLNSSLGNNVNRAAGMAAAVSSGLSPNAQANLTMNLPPSHPGWASEMSQKVAWVARDGGHTAHIRLDPPELGSLTVKVSVDSDSNTQVSFVAATPQARDLLESQMGRLRDMLAQQGMDLSRADVDVSQRDASGAQDRENYQGNPSGQGIADADDIDEELISNNLSYVSASGVDYYA
ncbi:flagellar hook-length control protein FliK [Marinomonas profundimaris]|uniref:Flagellar hook-length control protein-like C-terminal domain-containing protein n=1 Tax=Marinomonas profundimaris TaxID=1208321 RepID=W1RNL6_9GAMM|nr:flagellar hook-length control protein FliK [Marinomonas profundimaris]ETI58251.1 hypothetical protein D104_16910 [Marinomonas profundimaris]